MSSEPTSSDSSTQQNPPRKFLGLIVHQRIRTGEKHLAWSSVFMLSLLWFAYGFNLFALTTSLTFTIKKYNENPQIIALVQSIASVIMIGPFISYLSDQVWTRLGRRRLFVITAWVGGFMTMVSYAFLPQVAGVINRAMVAMGFFPVGELIVIIMILLTFGKMLDFGSPLEPLFMECVPPQQRGRFWAIRGMMFSLATMLFWQLLYPKFDTKVDAFAWCGHPGMLYWTGEQIIYMLGAIFYLLSLAFMTFCVEETKMPQAPNKSFRTLFLGERRTPADIPADSISGETLDFMARIKQIPIVTFAIKFVKDVFLKKENLPFYIILVIPSMEGLVWGQFSTLMVNDLFGYSKQSQADLGLPYQILGFAVMTPFAGWYSDVRGNVRWWVRILLLVVSVASFCAMLWIIKNYSPADIRQSPSFLILFWVAVCAIVSMITLFVVLVETMLDLVGREHARAWVSLLAMAKSVICTVLLYICIRSSPDQVVPIMTWMAFGVIGAALGGLMANFIGPMLFDYIPRSKIGTINAGYGIIETFVRFGAINLGAWWIVFATNHFHKPVHGKYDYTSLYLLQFVLFVPAIIAKVYFVWMVVTDKVKKWGVMEVEDPEEALKEEKEAGACE